MKKIYSFDIFDTCLGRICGEPKNLFDILALKVLGRDSSFSERNDFRLARINGEITAAEQSKGKQITIDDIYDNSDFSGLTPMGKEEIKLLELQTEEENLFAIYDCKIRIETIHKRNESVIYISDMYLPSSFLVKILKREGLWKNGDKIYVSCEHESTKSEGSLYDRVKRRENISLIRWRHTGDNFKSDFLRPLRRGIISKKVSYGYSFYEELYREKSLFPRTRIGTLVPAISRSLVLEEIFDYRVAFCADIIAPIYVPFVFRILKDANKRGIKNLFFLARDGYIFYKIAEVFKSLYPNIECHYLYVSRKSLYLPSLEVLDEASVKSLLMKSRSIEECTDALQIDLDVSDIECLKTGTSIHNAILSSDRIMAKLTDHWNNQKQISLEYFIQEGVASKYGDTAIVDLRGSRKSQICINKILKRGGFSPVYAYYLEVTKDRKISDDKYSSEFFADNITSLPSFNGLQNGKDILEHYFSITPFKRTSHYVRENNGVIPLFDTMEIVHPEAESIYKINERVCVEFARRLLLVSNIDDISLGIEPGLAVFSSFIKTPNRKYLKALLNVNTSQTQFNHRSLVGIVGVTTFFRKTICWYEGSFKYTYGSLGLWLYNKIISKCVRVFLKK